MNGHTQVVFCDDGSAAVNTGNAKELWSRELVARAQDASLECCESPSLRHLPENCPCIACCVTAAHNRWDREKRRHA